jgi:hypothetical protein
VNQNDTKPIMLAKEVSCGDDACPSVYLQSGRFTVQGDEVSLEGFANVKPGERGVTISIDAVRRALAAYDAGEYV